MHFFNLPSEQGGPARGESDWRSQIEEFLRKMYVSSFPLPIAKMSPPLLRDSRYTFPSYVKLSGGEGNGSKSLPSFVVSREKTSLSSYMS